ncbi:unnamed protein product [Phytophthora fragariaefolia]|uniref:Unnamed protein product n=1 Tax=Phytophthora fragariaefolia TaxID=1490495 RepID=A0A9W6XJA3_9STRA|nr:unnamed protein product [Phytophthora fragariaefolia]
MRKQKIRRTYTGIPGFGVHCGRPSIPEKPSGGGFSAANGAPSSISDNSSPAPSATVSSDSDVHFSDGEPLLLQELSGGNYPTTQSEPSTFDSSSRPSNPSRLGSTSSTSNGEEESTGSHEGVVGPPLEKTQFNSWEEFHAYFNLYMTQSNQVIGFLFDHALSDELICINLLSS